MTTLHRRAHDALHTAPTDLDAAAELVRDYGEALASAAGPLRGSAMICGRAGCPGTIIDGYCDDCGLAPERARAHGTEVLAHRRRADPRRAVGRPRPRPTRRRPPPGRRRRRRCGATASAPASSTSHRFRRGIPRPP